MGGIVYLSAVFLLLKDMYHEKSQLYMGKNKHMLHIFCSFIGPPLAKNTTVIEENSALWKMFLLIHVDASQSFLNIFFYSQQLQASHRRMIYHDLKYLLKAAQVLQSRSWRSNMLVEKKGPRFKFNGNSAKAKHLLIFFCLCVCFFCLGGGGGGGFTWTENLWITGEKS